MFKFGRPTSLPPPKKNLTYFLSKVKIKVFSKLKPNPLDLSVVSLVVSLFFFCHTLRLEWWVNIWRIVALIIHSRVKVAYQGVEKLQQLFMGKGKQRSLDMPKYFYLVAKNHPTPIQYLNPIKQPGIILAELYMSLKQLGLFRTIFYVYWL